MTILFSIFDRIDGCNQAAKSPRKINLRGLFVIDKGSKSLVDLAGNDGC